MLWITVVYCTSLMLWVAQVCIITHLVGHKIITDKYIWGFYFEKRIKDTTLLLRITFLTPKHCKFISKSFLTTDDWLCRWCAPRRGITGNNSELTDEKEEAWEYHRSLLWHCLLILVGRSAESQGNGWLQHAVWKVCMPLFEARSHTRYLQQGYSFLSGKNVCIFACLFANTDFPLGIYIRVYMDFFLFSRSNYTQLCTSYIVAHFAKCQLIAGSWVYIAYT